MKWVFDDGGRSNYFKGHSGDCFVRAVAIATGKDYKEVYDLTNQFAKRERTGKRKRSVSSARNGVYSVTAKKVMEELGWDWHPTMTIGSGCQVHLREDEVPDGNVIVQVAKHYVAVINGVIHDTWDSQEDGNRCVYGYWSKPIARKDMNLKDRIRSYKKDADYFLVDIYKGGTEYYETIRDLSWLEVQDQIKKAKKDEKVSKVEVWVEDWDGQEDNLFQYVETIHKTPIKWYINLETRKVTETAWK